MYTLINSILYFMKKKKKQNKTGMRWKQNGENQSLDSWINLTGNKLGCITGRSSLILKTTEFYDI